jgi:outer membrane autotransporter protein
LGIESSLSNARTLLRHAREGSSGAWIQYTGDSLSFTGTNNAPSFSGTTNGALIGIDRRLGNLKLGVAAGLTHGSVAEQDASNSNGQFNGSTLSLYGTYKAGLLSLDATAGYGVNRYTTMRPINVGTITRAASASYNASAADAALIARTDIKAANLTVTPRLGVEYGSQATNGFSESGANSLDLNVAAQTYATTRSLAGVDAKIELHDTTLGVRAEYQYQLSGNDRTITSTLAGATAAGSFTTSGVAPTHSVVDVGATVEHRIAPNIDLYLDYDAQLSGNELHHAYDGGLRFHF